VGPGPIVALTLRATIDRPDRFRRSRQVGAHLGLTPARYQSGETDVQGKISRCGDELARAALCEADHALLVRRHAFDRVGRNRTINAPCYPARCMARPGAGIGPWLGSSIVKQIVDAKAQLRLTRNRSKVLRAKRSMHVTVTTSPGEDVKHFQRKFLRGTRYQITTWRGLGRELVIAD
jgi:hypothetical protein